MGLHAKYDPRQDRMLVTLNAGGDKAESMWLTRRQWLSLLQQMEVQKLAAADADAPAEKPPKTPPAPLPGRPDAPCVDGVRLRKDGDGARLQFLLGDKTYGLQLPTAGLSQFRRLLEQQAERAGWDSRAGLERLDAALAAQAAMRKAKGA